MPRWGAVPAQSPEPPNGAHGARCFPEGPTVVHADGVHVCGVTSDASKDLKSVAKLTLCS